MGGADFVPLFFVVPLLFVGVGSVVSEKGFMAVKTGLDAGWGGGRGNEGWFGVGISRIARID